VELAEQQDVSWAAIARACAVSEVTVRDWRRRADCPKSRDPKEWLEWKGKLGLGTSGPKTSQSTAQLKDEKTRHEIELLAAKIAREKRRVIDREEVSRLLLTIGTRQRTMLYQFLETEAPPKLDGLSAAQARPVLRAMADEICDAMADLVKGFEQS
jgi:hypothetical protein